MAALALVLAVQCFYWTGPIGSDDAVYLRIASDPHGDNIPAGNAQLRGRITVWLPIRLTAWVVGADARALLVWPMVCGATTLALLALFAHRHLVPRAAPVAVLALGLCPVFVQFSTTVLPDVIAAAFVTAALVVCYPALAAEHAEHPVLRSLAAGLLLGMGITAAELSAFFLPAAGVFVVMRRRSCGWAWTRLGGVTAGASAWGAIAVLAHWHFTGDPLYQLHALSAGPRSYGPHLAVLTAGSLIEHCTDYLRWLADIRSSYGWWGPLFLAAAVLAFRRPPDTACFLLCCVLVPGLYLSAGSVDLKHYFPIYHQPRYLIPVLAPAALLLGDVAIRVQNSVPRIRPFCLAGGIAVVASSLWLPNLVAGRSHYARALAATRRLLKDETVSRVEGLRFVASPNTAVRLDMLMGTEDLPHLEPLSSQPTTATAWGERYANCVVWVLYTDGGGDRRGEDGRLSTESLAALRSFPLLARAHAPANRLNSALAALGVATAQSDPYAWVEVYQVADTMTSNADLRGDGHG